MIKLVSDLITESDQAVRAVHNCNSWFVFIFRLVVFLLEIVSLSDRKMYSSHSRV